MCAVSRQVRTRQRHEYGGAGLKDVTFFTGGQWRYETYLVKWSTWLSTNVKQSSDLYRCSREIKHRDDVSSYDDVVQDAPFCGRVVDASESRARKYILYGKYTLVDI